MENHKNPIVRIHSHVEMAPLEDRAVLDLQDESLDSPESIARHQHYNMNTVDSQDGCVTYIRKNSVLNSIKIVVFSTKLNLLIPFGPLAILVDKFIGNHGWVFVLSLLGIIPMAERLGFTTEQLAFFTGPTGISSFAIANQQPLLNFCYFNIIGGLLNATFGNATELIISILALRNGMMRVVQQSLLGSILSNMLLVLGCAFFSGGLVVRKREQVFNKAAAGVNCGLLLMAVMGLLFPAVLHATHTEVHFGKSELALSRFSSCVMLVAYAAFLHFQLRKQDTLYVSVDEGASVSLKMPMAFISVILLPIVGNAAEHASAIVFAMKDRLDISLGVAIGSSTQISMFGVPFCVVIGWIMGHPMDLNFQLFETATLFITVLVVAFMLQEGTSNYFKGLMLIFCYLIVAASFFVHIDPTSVEDEPGKPSG
ncbi:vacuolar cation/proton exchanger 2-like isoform X3 [Tripterygium wilfordii]|uniref:vacuolar cation/proton exchanger 2-like isoform X3 n=1 Tax=Tripterygium wilfordii TaxID=458696 RepID=UPI0018F7EC5D|nr:vacuolar cation/proton exchanger 2-like isoform X3 [Tripterygium wilfordii]